MTSQMAPHLWFPEPKLSFHPDRTSDQAIHPLRGLLRFGPYSAGLVPDPIRVATISPVGESNRLFGFMRSLNAAFEPTERTEYLPAWPGFHSVFGLHMHGAGRDCHLELEERLEAEFKASSRPHIVLAEALLRALQTLEARRNEFDVLFILYISHSVGPRVMPAARRKTSTCTII